MHMYTRKNIQELLIAFVTENENDPRSSTVKWIQQVNSEWKWMNYYYIQQHR